MTYTLRIYQREAVEAAAAFIEDGKGKNGLIVLPTGAGKSIVWAALAERLDARFILFQPSKEILEQNLSKFHAFGARPAVYSASMGRKSVGEITLATIGSVKNKAHLFSDFDFIGVDECDLTNAKKGQYKNFFDDIALPLIGMTATPYRLSSDSMGTILKFLTRTRPRIWHELIYYAQTADLFNEGFLAKLEYHAVQGFNRHKLRDNSTGADYTDKSIQMHMFEINFKDKIVKVIERLMAAGRKNALVFTRFVEEARYVVSKVEDAAIVTADTHKAEREAIGREFKAGNIKVIVNVGIYCLDEQTEILTSDGWVGIDGMTKAHEIAAWKKDGSIEFAHPLNVFRRERQISEAMVSVKGKGKDFRVTSNHRMVIGTTYGQKEILTWHDAEAKDIADVKVTVPVSGEAEPFPLFVELEKITPKRLRRREVALAYSLRLRGSTYEASNREATETVARNAGRRAKHPFELTVDECLFIGFWLGDGSRSQSVSGGVQCTLAQSLTYPLIIQFVDDLLARLGFGYWRREILQSDGEHRAVYWGVARGTGSREQSRAAGFYTVEPYLDKSGSSLFWGLNQEQFAALLHGFWMADGNHGDGVTPSERGLSVTGTQKPLYDLLQAIGVCRGYNTTITKQGAPRKANHTQQYAIHWRRANKKFYMRERPQLENAWQPERVWCVTSPTGYILTRRNGKVLVTGNSVGFDYPELEAVVLARPTKSLRLYYQQAGRCVRPHPAKETAWVVDMVGLVEQFGKLEDLTIVDGGNGKWFISSNDRPLTNVYFGDSGGSRCRECGQPIGFWARHERTGNAAPIQRPPAGIPANIAIHSKNGRTVYSVVKPGEGEFLVHYSVCGKQQMRATG